MKKSFLFLFIMASLFFSGCTFSLSGTTTDGGIFKSYDYGEHWEQKNSAGQSGKTKLSLNNINTKEIIFDQQDHTLIYLSSRENGLFVSENGGEEWRQVFNAGLVSSLALENNSKGILYIAVANKIYKTIDLGRNWRVIYLESRIESLITQVAVNPKNSKNVIASTSTGDILISNDAGESWNLVANLKSNLRKILINHDNPDIIYIASLSNGIFRSADAGKTWINLKEQYEKIGSGTLTYRVLSFDPGVKDGLFLVSDFGIINSIDSGQTWQAIQLLTPPGSVQINSFAVNPKNSQHIYYATANTFYRSFDGGKTWLNAKVPSTRMPCYLIVDNDTPNIIYMGVIKTNSKPFFFI